MSPENEQPMQNSPRHDEEAGGMKILLGLFSLPYVGFCILSCREISLSTPPPISTLAWILVLATTAVCWFACGEVVSRVFPPSLSNTMALLLLAVVTAVYAFGFFSVHAILFATGNDNRLENQIGRSWLAPNSLIAPMEDDLEGYWLSHDAGTKSLLFYLGKDGMLLYGRALADEQQADCDVGQWEVDRRKLDIFRSEEQPDPIVNQHKYETYLIVDCSEDQLLLENSSREIISFAKQLFDSERHRRHIKQGMLGDWFYSGPIEFDREYWPSFSFRDRSNEKVSFSSSGQYSYGKWHVDEAFRVVLTPKDPGGCPVGC